MKSAFLFLSLVMIASTSHAFTSRTVFTCMNNDKVEVTSSLMPTGKRHTVAVSKQFGSLKSVECKQVNKFWSTSGSENCFVGEKALFSHFGKSGMLKVNTNGRLGFTICQATSTIQ